jgi:hypothetical protein
MAVRIAKTLVIPKVPLPLSSKLVVHHGSFSTTFAMSMKL